MISNAENASPNLKPTDKPVDSMDLHTSQKLSSVSYINSQNFDENIDAIDFTENLGVLTLDEI